MARLKAATRKKLPKSDFAGPGRSFPVPDIEHGRKALQLMTHKSSATQAKIRAKVKAKFPSIGKK